MPISEPVVTTTTIAVFTRHSVDCPKRNDPQWRRCNCRKSLYIYAAGQKTVVSAKTRSWEQAERLAQAERDKRDPVQIELQKIAEREASKVASEAVQLKPLAEALDQWLTGMKGPGKTSMNAYRSTARKIQRWADREGAVSVGDVTPAMLDH